MGGMLHPEHHARAKAKKRKALPPKAKGCVLKLRFLFESDAWHAIAKLTASKRYRHPDRPEAVLRPYRCPTCGAWHIGHK